MDFRRNRTLKISSSDLKNAEPPPPDRYTFRIAEQTLSYRRDRDVLLVTFVVMGGEYEGRRLVQHLFVDDHVKLAELVRACRMLEDGEFEEFDPACLVGCEVNADLTTQTGESGKPYARLHGFEKVERPKGSAA